MVRRRLLAATVVVAITVAGCGSPMTLDGVTILRHGFMSGSPAALLTGTLRIRDGCVWADAGGEAQVVVWPLNARLERLSGHLVVVVDGVTVRDGDEFSIGGGQFTDVEFIRGLAGSIPDACVADFYWLGNDVTAG